MNKHRPVSFPSELTSVTTSQVYLVVRFIRVATFTSRRLILDEGRSSVNITSSKGIFCTKVLWSVSSASPPPRSRQNPLPVCCRYSFFSSPLLTVTVANQWKGRSNKSPKLSLGTSPLAQMLSTASRSTGEPRRAKPRYRKPKWIEAFNRLDPDVQRRYAFAAVRKLPEPQDVARAEKLIFPHLTSPRHLRNLFLIAPYDASLRMALMTSDRFDSFWEELYLEAYGGDDHHAFPVQSSIGRLGVLFSISRYLAIRELGKGSGHGKPGSKKQGGGGVWKPKGGKDTEKDNKKGAGNSEEGGREEEGGEGGGAAGEDGEGGDAAGGDENEDLFEEDDAEAEDDNDDDAEDENEEQGEEMGVGGAAAGAAPGAAADDLGPEGPYAGPYGIGDMFSFGGKVNKELTHAALNHQGLVRLTVMGSWRNEGTGDGQWHRVSTPRSRWLGHSY
ncbi:hypothetical protein BJ508DRAFT_304727 [Ascobolus immersus RN42]|uniref:Uncharacterized protein n=1 Tax=Ascobolus immersus RN42 TaxID=1160509 RepID=A0A3N4IBT5_ASCIM|nr:hypothetical protein BJ508DRAFT_304727 [Ascobolus immersus RN42]